MESNGKQPWVATRTFSPRLVTRSIFSFKCSRPLEAQSLSLISWNAGMSRRAAPEVRLHQLRYRVIFRCARHCRPLLRYVIDPCSGDGWFTFQIAKVARHVSAIDMDPNLLEVARRLLAESGVTLINISLSSRRVRLLPVHEILNWMLQMPQRFGPHFTSLGHYSKVQVAGEHSAKRVVRQRVIE